MNTVGQSSGAQFLGGDSLLLIPEVARFLRVSDKTIRRMMTVGKLRSVKICGKRVVKMSDLNELVRSQVGGPMYRRLIPPGAKHRTYRGRYRVGDNPKVYEVTLHTTVEEIAEKLLKETHEDAQRESVGLILASHTRKAKRRPIADDSVTKLFDVDVVFLRVSACE